MTTASTPMNLRQYWDFVGTENIRKIIFAIDSSMAYVRLMKYGLKRPGNIFALRFIDAAREITPGVEPDLEMMLRGVPRSGSGVSKLIQPSPEFLRQQSERQQSGAA